MKSINCWCAPQCENLEDIRYAQDVVHYISSLHLQSNCMYVDNTEAYTDK